MMDTKREHPDCAFVRQSLPLHTGGDLGRAAAAKVEAHVRVCRPCAELGERAAQARNVLVDGLGALADEGRPDILGGVRARLATAAASPVATAASPAAAAASPVATAAGPARRFRLVPWLGGAAAAAAALVVYFAVTQPAAVPGAGNGERVAELAAPRLPEAGLGANAGPEAAAPRRPVAPAPAAEAVLLAGRTADGDALRPLQANEVPLRHSALRTVEVPWMENNAGRVLTPGGAVSAVGWTVPVR